MKAVIQKVKNASCKVDGKITGEINSGLLVYFGVDKFDTPDMLKPFFEKLVKLRIFKDENDKMNLSVQDVSGKILFISQFTLSADIYRGNRPSFDSAEKPEIARNLYLTGADILRDMNIRVEMGVFGAHMEIEYINDGPETFILDSDKMKIFQKSL